MVSHRRAAYSPVAALFCIVVAKRSRSRKPLCRCGHCKHLTPEFKALGAAVAKDPSLKNRVVVAKVTLLYQLDLPSAGTSAKT